MSDFHPFLKHYVRDHIQARQTLADTLSQYSGVNSLQAKLDLLNAFFNFAKFEIEAIHERSEELFLFTAISKKADIRAGGPMCMLYFDMHCANHPLDQAARLTRQKRMQPSPTNVAKHLRPFLEDNSPVCIPLSDHMACDLISNHAMDVLKSAAAASDRADQVLELAQTYFKILSSHFEKEENCLFPMTQSLLNEGELNDCAAKSVIWEVEQRSGQLKMAGTNNNGEL